ncbi:MAG TPA: molybdenum cofactor biosynthesis protein B [Devosia sp.]|nr:molybdenum cofactor biosynthesis protein B [Devosia sp.]
MFPSKTSESKKFIPLNIAVLVVSDTRTLEDDVSGALLESMLKEDGHNCASRIVVKDDIAQIRAAVQGWVADPGVDIVITTGGTGFSGFDVTPEALEPLFDKHMEGFSALFHAYSANKIGTSTMLSRATAGLAATTFIFCLPGSKGACRDAWEGIIRHQLNYRHGPCNLVELMPRLGEHLAEK